MVPLGADHLARNGSAGAFPGTLCPPQCTITRRAGLWDVLAGAIIVKNKRNWLAMYHSLGVNISGDLFGQRATAFIDDALACLNA